MGNLTHSAGLSGKKEVVAYVGRPRALPLRWTKELNFPMVEFGGKWESDKELIYEWRRRQIVREQEASSGE
ncbi:MAG: hypothetical protein ABSG91_13695 [Syntrophobacteraceae bacterium]|jgi:hypothetical protein